MSEHRTACYFNQRDKNKLPGSLGIHTLEIGSDYTLLEMYLEEKHMNLRGFVHGGSVVTLADSAAGYGTYANLPTGAEAFTTVELKCNFIRGVSEGILDCRATCIHQGKTTQVWDSKVTNRESGEIVAEFRCTQMILYPRPKSAPKISDSSC